MAYIFFRGFLQLNDYFSSGIWLLICIFAVVISIYVWNETQVKIIIQDKDNSILIKKIFKPINLSLDEVVEYGRDNYHTRTSNSWRYYLILRKDPDKRITIFHDGLKDINVISAYIIVKAKNAKIVNIGPGMI